MSDRKIYCEIIEGICYEDRCLFKLSKIIEGNKTCEACILRETERLKSVGMGENRLEKKKKVKPGPKRKVRSEKKSNDD
jgi:hypothetical protein